MDEALHNWRLCYKCAHKDIGGDLEPYEFDETDYRCGRLININFKPLKVNKAVNMFTLLGRLKIFKKTSKVRSSAQVASVI